MDRARVAKVIRDFTHKLTHSKGPGAPIERARDPAAVREFLLSACRENDLSLEDYRSALEQDASLAELERQAMTAGVVDTPDPGPYAEISRESPSGQPGDLTKFRSVPRVPSAGN